MTGQRDKVTRFHYYFLAASLIIILLGIGHLLIELFSWYLLGPPDPQVLKTLVTHQITVFGFTRNLQEFMKGFSITMGAFMVAYGVLNFLLWKTVLPKLPSITWISLWNAFVCLTIALLSLLFFHWPPIIGFSIGFALYMIEFIKNPTATEKSL